MDIELIKCAGCGREIVVEFATDNSVVSIPDRYCLIADTIWHPLCWGKQCNDYYYDQRLGEDDDHPH
jgi:hypothetical protein